MACNPKGGVSFLYSQLFRKLKLINMDALIRTHNNQPVTTSRLVAEKFGKQHKDVLKAIRNLESEEDFNQRNFAPIKFTDERGRKQTEYAITRDGFSVLIMGFTGKEAMKFKVEYINAFNEYEKLAKKYYTNSTSLPNFIRRYWDNMHNLDKNHFSVISELFTRLYSQLEKAGYIIPDKSVQGTDLMPDISVGIGFAKYLREHGSHFYNTHSTYTHTFPSGKEVKANMYHIDALPTFIKYVNDVWIPEEACRYFKGKDPVALEYLPKLLGK